MYLNIRGTENCTSLHPGAHGTAYYGDGKGRDTCLVRSFTQLHGNSDSTMCVTSHEVGSPRADPPKEGRVSGYRGYIPGYRFNVGQSRNEVTAKAEAVNSPRGANDVNDEMNNKVGGVTSREYGAEVAGKATDYNSAQWRAQARVPVPQIKLSDSAGKSLLELQDEGNLHLRPPRAITRRSARLGSTPPGELSNNQVDLIRRILQVEASLLVQGEDLLIHIPVVARKLNMSEERLRSSLLSLEGCRLTGCGHAPTRNVPTNAAFLPMSVWDQALQYQ
eukprot:TRINITY_DN6308_c0_g1_i1.p1 TRINITY_DN6308_c0_g1~~TRINITY_DN6308_c0_g1_i1.p1  ORF type:complete len:277 (+),score=43.33 TRINITY_DN6308_c0_g1_i1:149-979(+)